MAASRRGAGRGAHPHRARLPSPLPAVRHDIFGLFSIVLQRATSHLRSTTLWVASFLLLLLLHLTSPGPSRPLATLGQCVAFLYACGVWRRLTRLWMTASFGRQWRRAMKRAVLDLRCGFAAGLARRGRSCSCRQEQALSAPAAAQAPAQYGASAWSRGVFVFNAAGFASARLFRGARHDMVHGESALRESPLPPPNMTGHGHWP